MRYSRAPGPAGMGAVPRGTGSHFARTYIQNWQMFVYVEAPFGSDLGGGPEPPLCKMIAETSVALTKNAL